MSSSNKPTASAPELLLNFSNEIMIREVAQLYLFVENSQPEYKVGKSYLVSCIERVL